MLGIAGSTARREDRILRVTIRPSQSRDNTATWYLIVEPAKKFGVGANTVNSGRESCNLSTDSRRVVVVAHISYIVKKSCATTTVDRRYRFPGQGRSMLQQIYCPLLFIFLRYFCCLCFSLCFDNESRYWGAAGSDIRCQYCKSIV